LNATWSGSESGTTPWGAFSSSGDGSETSDLTFDTTPQGTSESGSSTSSPPDGTSTGSPPTGPILGVAQTAAQVAFHGTDNAEQATAGSASKATGTSNATPNAPGTGTPAPPPPATPAPPAVGPPPPITRGANQSKDLGYDLFQMALSNTYYKTLLLTKQRQSLTNIGTNPNAKTRIGVAMDNYAIVPKLPPGYSMGTTGAGPCIGVVIADPIGRVSCYHFSQGNNPGRTLNMTNPGGYPKGTRAIIFGGDNSAPSNFTLGMVVSNLESNSVGYVYSNTTGGNVDSNGMFFLYKNDGGAP